jgi:hypothetical protein
LIGIASLTGCEMIGSQEGELTMKSLVLLVFTLVSMNAIAQQGRPPLPPGSIPGHDQLPPKPPGGWPDDWPHNGGHHGGGASCAPEVVDGNVAATQRVLASLASSPEFAKAQQFKSVVHEIATVRAGETRVARYFALIGIDSRDSAAVAEFVGAREVRGTWLASLEKSTGVTPAQADVIASKLQNALRGDLQ